MNQIAERTARPGLGASAAALLRRALQAASRLPNDVAAGLSRQAMNRRVLRKLAIMTDRELKDIGLVRQDVSDAVALPAAGDASILLLARRDERRGAARTPARAC